MGLFAIFIPPPFKYDCMRQVKLFIATSLDGFIADKNGGIDWLFTDQDYGYADFYASIDTTLTGYKTYEDILGFGQFPYPGKTNYVFSRRHQKVDDNPVTFIADDAAGFVQQLKRQPGRDIWLVGGGQINEVLLHAGLIDVLLVSIHPTVLGEGRPLFAGRSTRQDFTLINSKTFETGLVQLTYGLKDPVGP
jgi:dihydrofolate reductase